MRSKAALPLAVILWELVPAALLCALFASVGIMHVTSRVMVVRAGYELSKLDQERTELSRERDKLKLELATLKSPSRLEPLARGPLGLIPAPAGRIIKIETR